MQKIPTVFLRDDANRKYVTDMVHPACGWVLKGEGVPTRKYDGTCVRFDGQDWWARREVKPGKQPPAGWKPTQVDAKTGKSVGWEPIEQSGFAKWHADALANHQADGVTAFEPGTYELCGPKVNQNPEGLDDHRLIAHAEAETLRNDPPLDLIRYCFQEGWEGIVWHHPDGRMAKLKTRDYHSEYRDD